MFFEGKLTTDRNFIKQWIETHQGWPAVKREPAGRGETRRIEVGFAENSDDQNLTPVSWEEFFEEFDRNNLVFLYRESAQHGAYKFL